MGGILRPGVGRVTRDRRDDPLARLILAEFDARRLSGLSDGAAVASIAETRGRYTATQATAGNRPTYHASGINGHPAVTFASGKVLTSATGPAPASFTFLAVIKPTNVTTAQTIMSVGVDGDGSRQFRLTTGGVIQLNRTGLSTLLTGTLPLAANVPHVVLASYDGTSGAGAGWQDGMADGTKANTPPAFTEGGIQLGSVNGQAFVGDIGLWRVYRGVLTATQAARAATAVAREWGIPVARAGAYYVDTGTGSDSNHGRLAAKPLLTLQAAVTALGNNDGAIYVAAPSATPLREAVVCAGGGQIVIQPAPGQADWHIRGSDRWTSGWTADGGGVYHRAVSGYGGGCSLAVVETLTGPFGEFLRLTADVTTPTTPAEGKVGFASNTVYVHLPGGANPNSHTIETARRNPVISVYGTGRVTVVGAVGRYSNGAIFRSGSGSGTGGQLVTIDCTVEYVATNNGCVATANTAVSLECWRTVARYAGNDGFNLHGDPGVPVAVALHDCEGAYCDDEGASPHDDVRLTAIGGRYHHNASGGITGVNNAVMIVRGVEIDHNQLNPQPNEAGLYYGDQTSGSVTDCFVHDNGVRGIRTSVAGVTVTNTTSGVAAGNAAADMIA